MQRAATADPASLPPMPSARTTCPVCSEPIRGITAARPGEHRFVGCDHYASARFLRPLDGSGPTAGAPVRLGP